MEFNKALAKKAKKAFLEARASIKITRTGDSRLGSHSYAWYTTYYKAVYQGKEEAFSDLGGEDGFRAYECHLWNILQAWGLISPEFENINGVDFAHLIRELDAWNYYNTPDKKAFRKELREKQAMERKLYAKSCKEASKWFDLPMDVILTVGANNADLLDAFRQEEHWLSPEDEHELIGCGIGRRKSAIFDLLGEELFNEFHVASMGQEHSARLAHWLWESCRKAR